MAHSGRDATSLKILKIFGIDPKACRGFRIESRPGSVVTATFEMYPTLEQMNEVGDALAGDVADVAVVMGASTCGRT